ncbi:MAG TPA: glycosyltransferase family 2 protein [Candidatus Deferrimicrobiaceae bacterium]|nr:glycosyltransferase family 2 protein [Candidatus Deferrimicrobiaceae bacterium]
MAAIKPTVSFIIPALNEEANIADAAREAVAAMGDRFADYELLLFDDGSTDRTGEIMDELAAADPRHVRVTHNPTPRNLGGVYKQGIALARMDYVLMVPGDNENPGHALQAPFDAIGRAEIVLPYPVNSNVRGPARHLVSRVYVGLLNRLFGLRVRYYNGTVIHRTANLKGLSIETSSFAYQAEILIKLLCAGKSFVEVPIRIDPPKEGRRSRAFRWKNMVQVGRTLAGLFVALRVRRVLPFAR